MGRNKVAYGRIKEIRGKRIKMKPNLKILVINISIMIILGITIINHIGSRVNISLTLLSLDERDENMLSRINSDIVYEERIDNELVTYKIHEYDKVKHMILERNQEIQELYEFNGRVFLYNKGDYKEYNFDNEENNSEEFRDTLNSLDYVYNFCNELTFENYIRALRENKYKVKIKLNKYRVDIEQNYMFDGSRNIELYTDYFGRILSGIYYREPVGKWTKFLIGEDVKKVKLPKKLKVLYEKE